jgi:hypothetical protein
MQEFAPTLPGFAIALVSGLIGFVVGTLAAPISALSPTGQGVRMLDAFAVADARTDWRVGARLRRFFGPSTRSPRSTDDDWAVALVMMAVAVAAYVKYADAIVLSIECAAISLLVASTGTLITLYGRKVVASGYAVTQIIIMFALVGVGLTNGILLLDPLWGGNPLEVARSSGVSHLGPEGVSTLVFQVIAVPMVLGALIVAIIFCVASVGAAFVASGAILSPLWLVVYWASRWTTPRRIFWVTVGVSVAAFAFASGLIPHLMETLADLGSSTTH